jgi:sphinganine-1-phosphate aldolase
MVLEEFKVAKRNLNTVIENTLARWNLDTIDIACISVVLFLVFRLLYRNIHRIKQKRFYTGIKRSVMQTLLKLPFVEGHINKMLKKYQMEAREGFRSKNPCELVKELKEEGMDWNEIDTKLAKLDAPDSKIKGTGMCTGEYYTRLNDPLETGIVERCGKYLYYNLLHVDHLAGIRQAEVELISMFSNLLKGGPDSCGTSTSGGTESILLAVLAYRQYALETKGITEPEIILPESIHSAFYKACYYFKVKPITVPVDKTTYMVNVKKLKAMISKNTIAICLSGGNYPHGLVDPIPEVGKIADKKSIPIHVDCCLGGYSMIFSEELGFDVPKFNFEIPAVHTISIDPHKYGLAPKGISLVLFKNLKIKQASIFAHDDWMGGVYGTASITGSKPSASCVGAWISTLKQGKEGLRQNAKDLHDNLVDITSRLRKIPGVHVLGNPQLNTFAFVIENKPYDVLQVCEGIIRKKWAISITQNPSAFHFTLTLANMQPARDQLVDDIEEVVSTLEKEPTLYQDSRNSQIYCTKMKLPDGSILEKALKVAIAEFSVA